MNIARKWSVAQGKVWWDLRQSVDSPPHPFSYRYGKVRTALLIMMAISWCLSCSEGDRQIPVTPAMPAAQVPDVTSKPSITPPSDSDGDGIPDNPDLFPNDPHESADNDGDGLGDNADADDDNDGVADNVDKDVDGDGHNALIFQGDDCDDTNGDAYPNAEDPPDGIAVEADLNCDGVADAEIRSGFFVDRVTGDDANDGSSESPFESLSVAVQHAIDSMKLGRPKRNIYLISTEVAPTQEVVAYLVIDTLHIPPGVGIYGGYRPYQDGRRVRNLAKRAPITLTGNAQIQIGPMKGIPIPPDPTVHLDTLIIGGGAVNLPFLVAIQETNTTMHRTNIAQSGALNTLSVTTNTAHMTLTIDAQSEISSHSMSGSVPASVSGIVLEAEDAGILDVLLHEASIIVDQVATTAVGVKAFSKLGGMAKVNVTMRDATVQMGNGETIIGVLLGDSANDLQNMGNHGQIGQVLLERNFIYGGVHAVLSVGMDLYNATQTAVVRNNVIHGETKPETAGVGKLSQDALGARVRNSNVQLINNTVGLATIGISISDEGKELALNNNILASYPFVAGQGAVASLVLTGKPKTYEFRNNLFAMPSGVNTTYYVYSGPPLPGQKSGFIVHSNDPNALTKINGVFSGMFKIFTTGGGNIIGDPLFDVNDGYHLTNNSPAKDTGATLSSFTDDIDGQQREVDTWDIGADEYQP